MIDLTNFVGTTVPRLLARRFPDLLWRLPTSERLAYLTFDDGPTTVMTRPLLDLLARFDVQASFFLLGSYAAQHPHLVRDLQAAGHTIGNHTFTHPDAWRAPETQVLEELESTTKLLEDQLGAALRWMRPPYGRFTRSMRSWCLARRQRMTMWDVMPGDFLPSASIAKIERRILRQVRPGSIIVLHDNPKAEHVTPPALENVLRVLQGEGWQFAAL